LPWRRGAVDIVSVSERRRPRFESCQGIRFLVYHSSAVVYKNDLICMPCLCVERRDKGIGHKNSLKFLVIWYIFPPFWYVLPKKNLATLFKNPCSKNFEPSFFNLSRRKTSFDVRIGNPDFSETGLPDGSYIFEPKYTIWVNFGGSWNGRCWYILCTYGHLVYFTAIWYIYGHLVYFMDGHLV
jgi:hypothetical protein